jgi:hypothetical protein
MLISDGRGDIKHGVSALTSTRARRSRSDAIPAPCQLGNFCRLAAFLSWLACRTEHVSN